MGRRRSKRVDIEAQNEGERVRFIAKSERAAVEFARYASASFTAEAGDAGQIARLYFEQGFRVRITLDKEA